MSNILTFKVKNCILMIGKGENMKDIKKSFNYITLGAMILDVLFIILGLFLIINPVAGITSALVLFGVILVVSGLYSILKFLINNRAIFRFELIYGVVSLVVGLLALFKPFAIVNTISVLVGVWLLFSSIFKFAIAIELRRVNIDSWTFDMGISVLTIILSLLLIINPFSGYIVISTYAAIMIIMYAGMDLVEQFFIRKRAGMILKYLSK